MTSDDWSLKSNLNPCMKCGSIECSVCSEDIEILRQKLIEDIQTWSALQPDMKIGTTNPLVKTINKRFGCDK